MCEGCNGKFVAGRTVQLGGFVGQKDGDVLIGGITLHKIIVLRSDKAGETVLYVSGKVLQGFSEFELMGEAMQSLCG
jgi:hypothetical protein